MNTVWRSFLGGTFVCALLGGAAFAEQSAPLVIRTPQPLVDARILANDAALARSIVAETWRLFADLGGANTASTPNAELTRRFVALDAWHQANVRRQIEDSLSADVATRAPSGIERQAMRFVALSIANRVMDPSFTPEASTDW